jgi:hypothetical protein
VWPGFDPSVWRDLSTLREIVALQHQTPTKEWPLIYMEDQDTLLVVRQWPDGSITAYTVENPHA